MSRAQGILKSQEDFLARHPRFGRALARLRTKHLATIKTAAKRVVRASESPKKRTGGSLATWVRASNLQPVLEYLS